MHNKYTISLKIAEVCIICLNYRNIRLSQSFEKIITVPFNYYNYSKPLKYIFFALSGRKLLNVFGRLFKKRMGKYSFTLLVL